MTVLLFVKDHIRSTLRADDISLHFDEQNPTNEEEILQEAMIEQVQVRIKRGPKVDLG